MGSGGLAPHIVKQCIGCRWVVSLTPCSILYTFYFKLREANVAGPSMFSYSNAVHTIVRSSVLRSYVQVERKDLLYHFRRKRLWTFQNL